MKILYQIRLHILIKLLNYSTEQLEKISDNCNHKYWNGKSALHEGIFYTMCNICDYAVPTEKFKNEIQSKLKEHYKQSQ